MAAIGGGGGFTAWRSVEADGWKRRWNDLCDTLSSNYPVSRAGAIKVAGLTLLK